MPGTHYRRGVRSRLCWLAAVAAAATVALPQSAFADVALVRWCELQTAHFSLLSDMPPRRAIRLADALTRFKLAAEALVPPRQSPTPPPLGIVAFRRSRAFRAAFAVDNIAGFMRSGLERHVLAFGPQPATGDITQTAFHEYAHYLMRARQGMNYPMWYEEGFASLLSTMRFSNLSVTIGDVPLDALLRLNPHKINVRELVGQRHRQDWRQHNLTRLYAKAWLLVHMLELGEADGLPPYRERMPQALERMDAGVPAAEAIQTVLGADVEALEAQLRRYAAQRRLPTRRLAIETLPLAGFEQRCLTETEAALELGKAASHHHPAFARRLLQRVVAAKPDDADAWAALAEAHEDVAAARRAAAQALAIDPAHASANTRMAELTVAACKGSTADECLDVWAESARYYRRALRAQPAAVDAAYGLGVVYLHTGRAGNAVNYLRVAWRRVPWAARINYHLGEAYRLTGDAARARVHLTKALHWGPDAIARERAALALSLLGP